MHKIIIFIIASLTYNTIVAQKQKHQILFQEVDSILNHHYHPEKPGAIVSIIKKGENIYTKGIGMANLEYDISISDSTSFHIASISKQFTSFLALLLEEEGKISLEDDIRLYLPELENLPFKITIRQLANHTHGLPNLHELIQLKGNDDFERKMTHREVVDMLLKIKSVNFAAGEKYEYNNTGYTLLAEIIQRVEGDLFSSIIEDKIFNPLKMENSRAIVDPTILIKNKAYSYTIKNEEYINSPYSVMNVGSSGISTTIQDLSKWALNFHSPKIGSQSIIGKMTKQNVLNSGEVIQYGLGLESKNYRGKNINFHGGGDASYRSYVLHEPESKFSVLILSNSGGFSSLDVAYSIFDLLLQDQLEPKANLKKKIYLQEELEDFVGTYEMFPGTYYNVLAENDSLFFQPYGTYDKLYLPVISENMFNFPYMPHTKFEFFEDKFDFNIADFKYPCIRVEFEDVTISNLQQFEGTYRNEEFEVTFQLVNKNNQLYATSDMHGDIKLYPISKSTFYSNAPFFGLLEFKNDLDNGSIKEFFLSGNFFKNLKFVRKY